MSKENLGVKGFVFFFFFEFDAIDFYFMNFANNLRFKVLPLKKKTKKKVLLSMILNDT